jgi:hypothetical protein
LGPKTFDIIDHARHAGAVKVVPVQNGLARRRTQRNETRWVGQRVNQRGRPAFDIKEIDQRAVLRIPGSSGQ